MFVFNRFKKFHFVGIGGAGMSALADILLEKGCQVSGSDLRLSETTGYLVNKGAEIKAGHRANYVDNPDIVVVTAAVNDTNPEVEAARAQNIPIIKRAELLGQLMRFYFGIGVAGTHGKTTTTAMISCVLEAGNLDPLTVGGGKMLNYRANVRIGQGRYFVTEADEYDRSFLQLQPCVAVITSVEADHMECYQTQQNLDIAFIDFANKVPFFGRQIIGIDDKGVNDIIDRLNAPITTFGFSDDADIQARQVTHSAPGIEFEVWDKNGLIGNISLEVPGRHNVENALATVCVGLELQIPFDRIAFGLENFKGVHRRLEIKGRVKDILLFDDYAHHPTEMSASLASLKETYNRRIVLIFQPHLYTRTQFFAEQFGTALLQADVAIVTEIFPAREKAIDGVTGELLTRSAQTQGHCRAHYIEDHSDLISSVKNMLEPEDLVVTMGAGDIDRVADELLTDLQNKRLLEKTC